MKPDQKIQEPEIGGASRLGTNFPDPALTAMTFAHCRHVTQDAKRAVVVPSAISKTRLPPSTRPRDVTRKKINTVARGSRSNMTNSNPGNTAASPDGNDAAYFYQQLPQYVLWSRLGIVQLPPHPPARCKTSPSVPPHSPNRAGDASFRYQPFIQKCTTLPCVLYSPHSNGPGG